MKANEIKVGMGATYTSGSDSYAYVVVDWKSNQKGEVTEVTCVEPDLVGGGFGECAYAAPFKKSWMNRPRRTFKRTRKDHDKFTEDGCWMARFGLRIGRAVSYYDPSF